MKLIDRLLLKDLVNPFLTGLAMFTVLVFAVAFLPQATDMLLQGAGVGIVSKLVLLSMPEVITQTLPMALLLAGLLGFGRLSGDSETIAIFAAGISFPRAAKTVALAGVIVSVLAFLWNDLVVPPCKKEFGLIRQNIAAKMLKSDRPLDYPIRRSDNSVDKYVTVSRGYDARTKALKGVQIVQYAAGKDKSGMIEAELYCDRAIARDLKSITDWTYYNGWITQYSYDPKTGSVDSVSVTQFKELKSTPQLAMGMSYEEVLGSENTDPNARNFVQLKRDMENDRKRGRLQDARGKEVNLYGKIALPLAGMVFGIMGAALGCSTKRGGNRTAGFGLAIGIVFLYYVFYRSMWVVGQNGGMPPILASFLADIIGAVIAGYLAIKASR